jgi:hypothetical protein
MAWHEGLPPVSATIRCGGAEHRVTWRAGRLVLHDHDLAAETALRALGARPCTCLDVVDACRRYLRRLNPSGLWAAEGDPTGLVLPPLPGASVRLDVDDERRLDALRSLPAPFRRRLALAMFVAAGRAVDPRASWQEPPFGRVLTSLVAPAVAHSLDGPAAGGPASSAALPPTAPTNVDVRWRTVVPGERPRLDGEVGPTGGWAHLRISPDWVARVWARGMANVDGDLVLGVVGHDRADDVVLLHAAGWSSVPPGSAGRRHAEPARVIAVRRTSVDPG